MFRAPKKNVAAAAHFIVSVHQPGHQRLGSSASSVFQKLRCRLISTFGSGSCMRPSAIQKDFHEDLRRHFEPCFLCPKFPKKAADDFSGIAQLKNVFLIHQRSFLTPGTHRSIHVSSIKRRFLSLRHLFGFLEILNLTGTCVNLNSLGHHFIAECRHNDDTYAFCVSMIN